MLSTNTPYRILALDDHPMVLEGITHLLSTDPSIEVEGVTSSVQLFSILDSGQLFNLFILDLELPDTDGFEVLKLIRKYVPDTAILIYTMHEEPWILARLAHLDIQGVVSKSKPVSTLKEAVNAIRLGDTYYDDAFLEQLEIAMERGDSSQLQLGPAFQLSDRELQVLRYINQGLTTPEISKALFLSPNTVGTYRLRLMRKFDAHNVAQLIFKARKFLEQ